MKLPRCGILAICCLVAGQSVQGQWVERTYTIQPGWNAIFLDVDPYPNTCRDQFDELPVTGVWARRDAGSTLHVVGGALPQTLLTDPDWRVFYPSDSPHAAVSDFFILDPGRAYLIQATGTESFDWTVIGIPKVVDREWVEGGLNLTGFHVDPSNPPPLSDFLSPVGDGTEPVVYEIDPTGVWTEISDLATPITPGEGYLVSGLFRNGGGPAYVLSTYGPTFEYPRGITQQALKVFCEPGKTRTLTVDLISSDPAPTGIEPGTWQDPAKPVAGDLVLRWRNYNDSDGEWQDLPATVLVDGDATPETTMRFAIDRLSMPEGSSEDLFQSVLQVNDGQGYLRNIGVSGQSLDHTGLWTGTVTLDQVSKPFLEGIEQDLEGTPAKTSFRILLHVSTDGTVHLVDEATKIWRPIEGHPDGGESILVTRAASESLRSELERGLRNSKIPPPLRVSSVVFDLRDDNKDPVDLPLTGTFGPGETMQVTVLLHDNNPTNPYHHKYHPDHTWYADPMPHQIWNIVREIELGIDLTASQERSEPGWGDEWLKGTYVERITGIHKNPIEFGGTVEWRHISRIGDLNAGEEAGR